MTLGLLIGLILAEVVARMMFTSGPARWSEPLRAALAGELLPEVAFQRSIPQPYLLYSPAPGHRSSTGEIDHNMQGYRGLPVSLARTPGIIRVLCLGGSTTTDGESRRPPMPIPLNSNRCSTADPREVGGGTR